MEERFNKLIQQSTTWKCDLLYNEAKNSNFFHSLENILQQNSTQDNQNFGQVKISAPNIIRRLSLVFWRTFVVDLRIPPESRTIHDLNRFKSRRVRGNMIVEAALNVVLYRGAWFQRLMESIISLNTTLVLYSTSMYGLFCNILLS